MTRGSALRLYGRVLAAFPSAKRTDETRDLWCEWLERSPVELGRQAVDDVIGSWRLAAFPPLGILTEALDLRRQAAAERPSGLRALQAEQAAPRETSAYWLSESRKLLVASPGPQCKHATLPKPLRRTGEPIAVGDALSEAVARLDSASAAVPDVEANAATGEELRRDRLDELKGREC
jgi:hypothetical protein